MHNKRLVGSAFWIKTFPFIHLRRFGRSDFHEQGARTLDVTTLHLWQLFCETLSRSDQAREKQRCDVKRTQFLDLEIEGKAAL